MVKPLGPSEAQSLLSAGNLDIVDVRDPRDWASGHVPGARSVPLDDLRADPKGKLFRDGILFVCARGQRSMMAAQAAERAGFKDLYSLEGGLIEWASAGYRVEAAPSESEPAAQAAARELTSDAAASCGLPEPGLDAVVAANLKSLRGARGLSLDTLARLTGLSRTLLGQVELGKTSPSVALVWKLARAFDVPFSVFLASASSPTQTQVLRANQAKRLVTPDGRFSSRALFPAVGEPDAEFYELLLGPYSREDAQAHQPGTRENLVVVSGRLELEIGTERFELGKGDAIVFSADVAHSYVNPDKDECKMYLVMTYRRRSVDAKS